MQQGSRYALDWELSLALSQTQMPDQEQSTSSSSSSNNDNSNNNCYKISLFEITSIRSQSKMVHRRDMNRQQLPQPQPC